MGRLNTLFNVFILVLQWESKRDDGTKKETWATLLSITNELARIKEGTKQRIPSKPQSQKSALEPVAPKSSLESLPWELIEMVLEYITDQETLYNLSLTNRFWNTNLDSRLFIRPYLTSPNSIQRFVERLDDTNRHSVVKVEFGPTTIGSLTDPKTEKGNFQYIPYVHSGLFRLLIHERDTDSITVDLIHPIFYELANKLSNCLGFDEFGYHKEQAMEPFYAVRNRTFRISRVPSSSMTLTSLFRACQTWFNEYPEWEGLKSSLPDCLSTCILLLEWFQGDYHPIWHRVGGDAVRQVKPLVNSLIRNFLSHVYTTLLFQVRFITSNSQRLLDCYCLIYYRVLSMAQSLDVFGLAEAMGYPKSTNTNIVSTSEFLLSQNQEMTSSEPSFSDVLASNSNTPRSSNTSVESVGLTTNQDAARNIYECLILVFHFRIPEKLHSSKTVPRVPAELLKEILITFPPSTINSETIELLGKLLQHPIDVTDPTAPLLETWFRWFKEIIQWHEASKEMDPVKDLLRKSMGKIDYLRSLQRQYGLVFMD